MSGSRKDADVFSVIRVCLCVSTRVSLLPVFDLELQSPKGMAPSGIHSNIHTEEETLGAQTHAYWGRKSGVPRRSSVHS